MAKVKKMRLLVNLKTHLPFNNRNKLARLLADGWQIMAEHKEQTWFGQDNGRVIYTLIKSPEVTKSSKEISVGNVRFGN